MAMLRVTIPSEAGAKIEKSIQKNYVGRQVQQQDSKGETTWQVNLLTIGVSELSFGNAKLYRANGETGYITNKWIFKRNQESEKQCVLCSTAQLIQTDHPNGSRPNLIENIGPVYYRFKYFVGIIVDKITEGYNTHRRMVTLHTQVGTITHWRDEVDLNEFVRVGPKNKQLNTCLSNSVKFPSRDLQEIKNILGLERREELLESPLATPSGDVPQTTDHYMEPAQHGVQDVLNISTEVHVFHRAILDLGRARLSLGGEKTKDGHAFSSGGPSGQSRKRPYLYPVHPSGSDESRHLDWSSPFSVP
ncbi:hypothetical protein YC2023_072511 [Brassica napus]